MEDTRYKVLLVDDDVIAHQMVMDMLRGGPFELFRAGDWSTMSEVLFCETPEVILLDVRLPGVNGDSIALVVHDTVVPRPRIILYSATPVDELAKLAEQAQVFSYFEKGGSQEELIHLLRTAAEDYRASNSAPPDPPAEARVEAGPVGSRAPAGGGPLSPPVAPRPLAPLPKVAAASEPEPLPPARSRPARNPVGPLPDLKERSVVIAAAPGERRSMAQTRMLSSGFLVHTADDWLALIQELGNDRTGLILLDPEITGISAIRLKKTIEAKMSRRPRVLLWTATSPVEIEGLARDLHADGVVSKEVSARALSQIVGSAMRGR